MRQIDADALREQLQNRAYDDWNQGVSTSWANAYREVADMVEDMPTIELEQRWIPIEERSPRFGENVLVSYWDGVFVDWLTQSEGNAYFFISGVAIQDIDAWMPLPEPFQRGEEDEHERRNDSM